MYSYTSISFVNNSCIVTLVRYGMGLIERLDNKLLARIQGSIQSCLSMLCSRYGWHLIVFWWCSLFFWMTCGAIEGGWEAVTMATDSKGSSGGGWNIEPMKARKFHGDTINGSSRRYGWDQLQHSTSILKLLHPLYPDLTLMVPIVAIDNNRTWTKSLLCWTLLSWTDGTTAGFHWHFHQG